MNDALRKKRELSGFTQVQVADKVGISERSYQRYESGERVPDVYQGQQIANVLGCKVEQLFCLTEKNNVQ